MKIFVNALLEFNFTDKFLYFNNHQKLELTIILMTSNEYGIWIFVLDGKCSFLFTISTLIAGSLSTGGQ